MASLSTATAATEPVLLKQYKLLGAVTDAPGQLVWITRLPAMLSIDISRNSETLVPVCVTLNKRRERSETR
jgi:hypothetical protein